MFDFKHYIYSYRWEDFIVREFRGQNYAKLTDLAPIPDPTPEVTFRNTYLYTRFMTLIWKRNLKFICLDFKI